jgi:hypothetical protein
VSDERKLLSRAEIEKQIARATAPLEAERQKFVDKFLRDWGLLGEPPDEQTLRREILSLLDHPYALAVRDKSTVRIV